MYSFSSASHMCEPLPRTINGGSPPTERKPRTGEFTPPGIMLSARFCRRFDCSVLRIVLVGIKSSRLGEKRCQSPLAAVTEYYSSAPFDQFIRYSSICNRYATSQQYRRVICLPF